MPVHEGQESLQRQALRAIAAFEAFKGALALAAGLGLLSLLHHDLHHLAVSLIGHIGLDPGAHYPAIVLHDLDQLQSANLRALMAVVALYVGVRWTEAYGLWRGRAWAEWLGAVSGAVYVPFEYQHWAHHRTLVSAAVMGVNLLLVAFLAWRLWRRRRG